MGEGLQILYTVTSISNLNLLGKGTIVTLNISIDKILFCSSLSTNIEVKPLLPLSDEQNLQLQEACTNLCDDYGELFKSELGYLKNFKLEIQAIPEAKPTFFEPRPVPFSMQSDFMQALDAGIKKAIWTQVQFNDWGTPIVPVRKRGQHNASCTHLRVCGDYSATVNPQLKSHHHPLPCPEKVMQRQGGRFGFTKIDLADAYNQIRLAP